ncbi:branched-chain amino acid ABC transporter permease [Rhizobium leguminosarum]|nr:branched-chain amino acid ABC transporter permease [Rhizobium leguminosarum]
MMNKTKTFVPVAVGAALFLIVAAWALPTWNFVISIGLAKGLAVLGLVLMMRAGLVSFGQGLYYAIGGYSVGLMVNLWRINEAVLLLIAPVVIAAATAAVAGLLLSRYRDIFFTMLTLALSMLLYGLLVKSVELGGTDGFNIRGVTLFGLPLSGTARFNGLVILVLICFTAVITVWYFGKTALGRLLPGIKDNEIRVEYLGASASKTIYLSYILAAILAAVGGSMSGILVAHVDPEMAFWATSGEFVVIAVLAGTGNIFTPFIAALALEFVRTFAYQHAPNTWQLVLGVIILSMILFLPTGLGGIRFGKRNTTTVEAGEKA